MGVLRKRILDSGSSCARGLKVRVHGGVDWGSDTVGFHIRISHWGDLSEEAFPHYIGLEDFVFRFL